MSIQTNRTLGGIGACLTVIGAVSGVSSLFRFVYPDSLAANLALSVVSGVVGVLGFVGFILFFIAMYGFSKVFGEHRIFSYILWGLIITIIAAVVAAIIFMAILFLNLASLIPTLNPSSTSSTQITSMTLTYFAPFFAVVGFVALINVVLTVMALNLLATKSEVPLFRSAAKVLLAGAALTIVLGIVFAVLAWSGYASLNTLLIVAAPGGLVQDIAWILLAVAFFRIRAPPPQTFTQSTVSSATGQAKYCSNCGTPNQTDATYCTRCGQKL